MGFAFRPQPEDLLSISVTPMRRIGRFWEERHVGVCVPFGNSLFLVLEKSPKGVTHAFGFLTTASETYGHRPCSKGSPERIFPVNCMQPGLQTYATSHRDADAVSSSGQWEVGKVGQNVFKQPPYALKASQTEAA